MEYLIIGLYSGIWETVVIETDFNEAQKRLFEYKENEPNIKFMIERKEGVL